MKDQVKLIELLEEYKELVPTIDKAEGPKDLIDIYKEAIKILRKVDRIMEKINNDKN